MLLLGPNFEKSRYTFTYARREFLGEVGCFVFDVQPVKASGSAPGFIGRIWIEDRDFNIVRFNGTRTPSGGNSSFHFDSWRENMGPGLWLPSYIYSEESDLEYFMGTRKIRFKAMTRLWGYNVGRDPGRAQRTGVQFDGSPLAGRRIEESVLDRWHAGGLLAPDGQVNRVLETVINNLQITNNLNFQPPVRARVLLTSPLESFTIGNTIVLTKGFIDVLPDEASLALVLAHELAHIYLGHRIDLKYDFDDRALFADQRTFMKLFLQRTMEKETAADTTGIALLTNSPYKDKLETAALFLRALEERTERLPTLLRPHLAYQMEAQGKVKRMAALLAQAPKLEMERTDQIAALPLGGRIRVDPWDNNIELNKMKNVELRSPREKLLFEVTPIFLHLKRQEK
jgi:hypothetical protein